MTRRSPSVRREASAGPERAGDAGAERIPTFGAIDAFDRHAGATTWHHELWRLGEAGGDDVPTCDCSVQQTDLHLTPMLPAA